MKAEEYFELFVFLWLGWMAWGPKFGWGAHDDKPRATNSRAAAVRRDGNEAPEVQSGSDENAK